MLLFLSSNHRRSKCTGVSVRDPALALSCGRSRSATSRRSPRFSKPRKCMRAPISCVLCLAAVVLWFQPHTSLARTPSPAASSGPPRPARHVEDCNSAASQHRGRQCRWSSSRRGPPLRERSRLTRLQRRIRYFSEPGTLPATQFQTRSSRA